MSCIPIVTPEELETYRDTTLSDTASLAEQAICSCGNFDVGACEDPPKERQKTDVSSEKATLVEGTGEAHSREEASRGGAAREESCREVQKQKSFLPKIHLSLHPVNIPFQMRRNRYIQCISGGTLSAHLVRRDNLNRAHR